MTWMQGLKRVFNINIETCESCGGQVKVIASIEAPAVIAHILKHGQGGIPFVGQTFMLCCSSQSR